jgi:GMP reductase
MDTVASFKMAKTLAEYGIMTALHKHYSIDEYAAFFNSYPEKTTQHVFYTTGIKDDDYEKLDTVMAHAPGKIKNIAVDVANGYTNYFMDRVKIIREKYHDVFLMAGNVVTPEMVEQMILNGVDIVKVGIGSGSACLTRVKAGIGYPQLSAVIECADAAHGLNGYICSDGGCTVPGDIVKAFAGGADYVMLGGMLAGHDETDCETKEIDGNKFMKFYGMSSEEAMSRYSGGVAEYKTSEGKCVWIPYKGPVDKTVQDILGGLRSACTYVGAIKLKNLSKCTTFIKTHVQENRIFS